MKEIVSRAEAALHETIQSKNAHPPHLGLLIAFIRFIPEKARTNPSDDPNLISTLPRRNTSIFFISKYCN